MSQTMNEIGKRYGRLIVLERRDNNKSGNSKWLCQCDCGKQTTVFISNVRKGSTRSCGCLAKEKISGRRFLGYGISAFNMLLGQYKRRAKQKGWKWELTKDWFQELTKSKCYWCGTPPQGHMRIDLSRESYTYNGVDRVDNTQGYTKDNSVSCCTRCNQAKNDMSEREFIGWLDRIHSASNVMNVFSLGMKYCE